MKKNFFKCFILFFIIANVLLVHAQVYEQGNPQSEAARKENERQRELQKTVMGKNQPTLRELGDKPRPNSPVTTPLLSPDEQAKLNADRSPNSEDLIKYSEFLKQKKTGIFRLFPDLGCEKVLGIVRVDGDCANAVINSWSYSFQKVDYGEGDVRLKDGSLFTDSYLSQNIVVGLGDMSLENVSLGLDQAKFLLDFKPETKSKKAKEQFWQISKKITFNNFTYGKVIRTDANTTFLMRIIAYHLSTTRFPESFNKKRRDKIIAFRIIRKDSDDSITILWKELADKKSPKLEFERDEKTTDLKEK
ncbi:MAG TPA: hypothetical protein PKY82_13185 [Pyrinomonadaceae bacterium]|nr:hypothetical protein [Pyrinomonadaceae bacterium]